MSLAQLDFELAAPAAASHGLVLLPKQATLPENVPQRALAPLKSVTLPIRLLRRILPMGG